MALRGDGVLICEDCRGGGGCGGGRASVDCWDDGAIILVFEEMFESCGVSFVERIEEGGVEGAEGEFVDYVGEVERYNTIPFISI